MDNQPWELKLGGVWISEEEKSLHPPDILYHLILKIEGLTGWSLSLLWKMIGMGLERGVFRGRGW